MPMETKYCPKCDEVKPLDAFPKNKSRRDGLNVYCKACAVKQWRAYRTAHLEEERARDSAYYAAHREQAMARGKIYRTAHLEECRARDRAYRTAHLEESAARGRAWREANPERAREVRRASVQAWRAANPEKARASVRASTAKHPEKQHVRRSRRSARERNAEGAFTTIDITRLYEVQQGLCAWCSQPLNGKYHIDHVIPLSRGGSNWPHNLVLACASCNLSKHDKLPYDEWQPLQPLFMEE